MDFFFGMIRLKSQVKNQHLKLKITLLQSLRADSLAHSALLDSFHLGAVRLALLRGERKSVRLTKEEENNQQT